MLEPWTASKTFDAIQKESAEGSLESPYHFYLLADSTYQSDVGS